MNDLVYRLRKRAEIRRQIHDRKSVQEGQPDRIADLLEEAADYIEQVRVTWCPPAPYTKLDTKAGVLHKEWVGLTDEEVKKIVDLNTEDDYGYDIWCNGRAVARDVEAKLKEKNT